MSRDNVFVVVDPFDVSPAEKHIMKAKIKNAATKEASKSSFLLQNIEFTNN